MFGRQKRCSVCLRSDDVDCPGVSSLCSAQFYQAQLVQEHNRPVFSHCFLALMLLASYPGAGDYSQFQTNQVMPVPTGLLFLVNARV